LIQLFARIAADDFLEASSEEVELREFRLSSPAFPRSANTSEELGGKQSGFVAAGSGANLDDDALFVEGIFREQKKFCSRSTISLRLVSSFSSSCAICFISASSAFDEHLGGAGKVLLNLFELAVASRRFLRARRAAFATFW